MKNKIVYVVIALITVSITGYSVYTAQKSNVPLSGLNLVNTEILASADNTRDFWIPCYSYVSVYPNGQREYVRYCGACAIVVESTSKWGNSVCTLFW